MLSRFQWLLAGALSFLFITSAYSQQRFARGLLIYKSVPSDTPNYFNGVLFLSSSASAIWREYDIGQSKPFRITSDLFVSEIQFGAMFEADFTSQQHLDFCKNIQSQLSEAAKQSPKVSSIAKATNNAIQTEVDKYNKGLVRFRGNWVERGVYLATIDAEQKQKMAALNAKLAAQAEIDASIAANAAEERRRKSNLSASYASLAAKYLTGHFDAFVLDAVTISEQGRTLPVRDNPKTGKAIMLPQYRSASFELLLSEDNDSENTAALLYAFNDDAEVVAADIAFHLVADDSKQKLLNKPEVNEARQLLSEFSPQLFDLMPDILAAAKIKRILKGDTNASKLMTFSHELPNLSIRFQLSDMSVYQDKKFRQFILIQIRPAA